MMMLFAFSASAETYYTEGYYTYSVWSGEATIRGVDTSISGDVIIPSSLGGYSVTGIGYAAFKNCEKITSVTLPNSVRTISNSAFYGCTSLEDISIPDSVTSIGTYAFYNCTSLKSVIIPDSVKFIDYCAFYNCTSLNSITVPDSVSSIGHDAFYNTGYYNDTTNWDNGALYVCNHLIKVDKSVVSCVVRKKTKTIGGRAFEGCKNLTSIIIPDSVNSIDGEAFDGCNALTSITVDDKNTFCSSVDGVLFNKDKTTLIRYPAGTTRTSYVIPDGVTTIHQYAFDSCESLNNISLPDSLINIEFGAFWLCTGLESITLPHNVKTIGNCAFMLCKNLTSITIPDSVTSIVDSSVFSGCYSLNSIIVDENNKYYCSVDGVLFNKEMTRLIKYPAMNTKTSYEMPSSVESIGSEAFERCKYITSIAIPDSVTSIGDNVFDNCTNLKNITLGNNITSIGYEAFLYCKNLTNIIIPDSVKTIGSRAFYWCSGLTSITIGSGVKSISSDAFWGCVDLADVYYTGFENQWNEMVIALGNGVLTNSRIHFSSNSLNHPYSPIVTLPTCIEKGYTSYVCDCGYVNKVEDYVQPKGHDYISIITKQPTHKEEGIKTLTCACGDTYTESVAKILHSYNKFVTAPTCTERGYTTYTCSCGDSYVSDYVGTKAHSYSSTITRPATHLTTGIRTYTCTACGDTYTGEIPTTKEHIYTVSNIVAPTCEEEGYTVYVCECGYGYNGDSVAPTGHNYNGDTCVDCGESKMDNCTCNCHKGGFMGFIWKILRFFYKLFDTNKTCSCGVAHY